MIEIIPAMDIIGGKCVRLTQGDFSRETVYSDDPLETAKRFTAFDGSCYVEQDKLISTLFTLSSS